MILTSILTVVVLEVEVVVIVSDVVLIKIVLRIIVRGWKVEFEVVLWIEFGLLLGN